jgi:hypothetical protein
MFEDKAMSNSSAFRCPGPEEEEGDEGGSLEERPTWVEELYCHGRTSTASLKQSLSLSRRMTLNAGRPGTSTDALNSTARTRTGYGGGERAPSPIGRTPPARINSSSAQGPLFNGSDDTATTPSGPQEGIHDVGPPSTHQHMSPSGAAPQSGMGGGESLFWSSDGGWDVDGGRSLDQRPSLVTRPSMMLDIEGLKCRIAKLPGKADSSSGQAARCVKGVEEPVCV